MRMAPFFFLLISPCQRVMLMLALSKALLVCAAGCNNYNHDKARLRSRGHLGFCRNDSNQACVQSDLLTRHQVTRNVISALIHKSH